MPEYRHSHIVSAGYLRSWATDERLSVGWADGKPRALLPVKSVGVRSGFYRERLPDGSTLDRLEPAMSKLEKKALRVIRSFEEHWPLSDADRAPVAEFLALQLMRSPAWRDWYSVALDNAHRWTRESRPEDSDESLEQARDHMALDTMRHERIVSNLGAMGTVFANMRWTVLRCGAPRLATSDHPLVPVCFAGAEHGVAVTPLSAVPLGGVMSTHELRFALTPRLLLVLTWADDFGLEQIVKAPIEQVRNHNGAVIGQAEVHWFHHPERYAERISGPWPPLAGQLHGDGYEPRGLRWHVVKQAIGEMTEADDRQSHMRFIQWGELHQRAA